MTEDYQRTDGNSTKLQPLSPEEGVELFNQERQSEVANATLRSNKYRLKQFVGWCKSEGIDNLNDLTGRHCHQYRLDRIEDGCSPPTIRSEISVVRIFLRFCESIEAIPVGLPSRIELPQVSKDDGTRDTTLPEQQAEQLLDHLQTYEYASRNHLLIELLYQTGMRIGELRSLDVDDFDAEDERIKVQHRPEGGTPLKNGEHSERYINLFGETPTIIEDYVSDRQPEILPKNKCNRTPLFCTENGRMSPSAIRRWVNYLTQPCIVGECPIGKERSTCEYDGANESRKCPESVSPHSIRRTYITRMLKNDTPEKLLSDRCDVSADVLEDHYDSRSQKDKAEQRRRFLEGRE